jgi:hypothetical protein
VYSEEGETQDMAKFSHHKDRDILVIYRGALSASEALRYEYEYDGEHGADGLDGLAPHPLKAKNGREVSIVYVCVCVCLMTPSF